MLQNALREDALVDVPGGYELRVGLPWIRSMPLACISGLSLELDGWSPAAEQLRVRLGDRMIRAYALGVEAGWWFIQDRLVLAFPVAPKALGRAGKRSVTVDFELMVPYLQGGGDGPLVLPFHLQAELVAGNSPLEGISRDVA